MSSTQHRTHIPHNPVATSTGSTTSDISVQRASAKGLFDNPVLSDVKIKQIYDGKTRKYYAHKAVLSVQSGFFLRAFTGSFREASENEMDVHGDDPDLFEFAFKFMYSGLYDHKKVDDLAGEDNSMRVLLPVGIYALANKYDIPNLEKPAADDFQQAFALTSTNGVIGYRTLAGVVNGYYEICSHHDSYFGMKIVSEIFKKGYFPQDAGLRNLLPRHPFFASDVALYCQNIGFLDIMVGACKTCSHVHYFKQTPNFCEGCRTRLHIKNV